MKSKFALSFGFSLIIVGILNIFFETTSIVLFGLSISTFVFSLINIVLMFIEDDSEESKFDLIYIIPFVILLSVCCYGNELIKIKLVNDIVNGNILNVLTFISFGFLFISEYINYIKNTLSEQIRILSIIEETYDYTILIMETINNYRNVLIKKEIACDKETKRFVNKLENLCDEKIKKVKIDLDLLKLEKEKFSIDDFDKIYVNNTKILKQKKSKKNHSGN